MSARRASLYVGPARERVTFDAAGAAAWARTLAGPVVFTNGVFDLLHRGHVDLLERARSEGWHLIVGVNSDRSARRLGKGPGTPVVRDVDRAYLVAALAAVDLVVLFNEDTPAALIAQLRPHVLVKGGDYDSDDVVGGGFVRAHGGRVVIVPLSPGYSTTATRATLRAQERANA